MDMTRSVSQPDASDSYWAKIVASTTPQGIAKMILADARNLDVGYSASPLAMHLPKSNTKLAMEIASYLTPSTDLDPEIKQFLYDKMRSRLRDANQGGDSFKEPPLPGDNYLLASEMDPELRDPTRVSRGERSVPTEEKDEAFKDAAVAITGAPTGEEIKGALKVLEYIVSAVDITSESLVQIQGVRAIITNQFLGRDAPSTPDQQDVESRPPGGLSAIMSSWDKDVRNYHIFRPPTRQKVCYICRFLLKDAHPVYKSMCRPCGSFNYAGMSISLPTSLRLSGKTALVTGARVNLGYRTALRLLRCGAMVIATTRYPNDSAVRYSQEPDFEDWKDRLKVIGADFRTARDAFGLVKATRTALQEWGAGKLHILINNAAQTLTDSIKKEERAIVREQQQSREAGPFNIVQQTNYQPRVRGGITPLALYGGESANGAPQNPSIPVSEDSRTTPTKEPEVSLPDNVKDDGRTELAEPYFKSSWVQDLNGIPYEDIISAHAVNAFVPLILCRELLPLMGEPKNKRSSSPSGSSNTTVHSSPDRGLSPSPPDVTESFSAPSDGHVPGKPANKITSRKDANRRHHLPPKPLGYIINVSSREGLFETRPSHGAKRGHHVHTNMTKAAINMIVQTEASSAWESRRVSMNTVDPGYMSAAPEMDSMFDGQRPLDWEDGAGRVLWPVAVGEVQGRAVWGRYLKHFGATGVGDAVER